MHDKRLFYGTIAPDFDRLMNAYDITRRLELIFDELLSSSLAGLNVLDLGCGTGWFSQFAHELGAEVTALDIDAALLKETCLKAPVEPIVGDALNLPFCDGCFDLIVTSEMIEHTLDAALALHEMARVLKPEGVLLLTTPNRIWLRLVNLATHLRLRPYRGYEHFLSFQQLPRLAQAAGFTIERHVGIHAYPFQLTPLNALSRRIDKQFGTTIWARWMINQAIRATKRSEEKVRK
jgi:ubiquinone/menaquinone biosynthesis C-methylase UbiE